MDGWSKQKINAFKDVFNEVLNHVVVDSKETGRIVLGQSLYRAQRMLLDCVYEGLAQGIHDFKVLKARQLGCTTISRPLVLVWMGWVDGIRGYLVFDTMAHLQEARLEMIDILNRLPKGLMFPKIVQGQDNRYMLGLDNGSRLTLATAGVRASKTSGTLGRSSGINLVHATEMCSWDNAEGLEAFRNALAEDYENRFYLWESTGRGYNLWYDIWMEAKADPDHQKTLFLGWWAKDNQELEEGTEEFEKYGTAPPTKEEIAKMDAVYNQYGWTITRGQLAWIRRKIDPSVLINEHTDNLLNLILRQQEQPWTEEEAFVSTEGKFFENEGLTTQVRTNVINNYTIYSYLFGTQFSDTQLIKPLSVKTAELKIWEEPVNDATYIFGIDCAYGINDKNDRSAIEIIRCFSDGVDQVAEFASPIVNPQQFAWVIAHLLGYYGKGTSTCYVIMDIQGPGDATWREIRNLKQQLNNRYYREAHGGEDIQNIFRNVKNYIDARADAVLPSKSSWQFQASGKRKVIIMEQLRIFTSNAMLTIRSKDLISEMQSVQRDGDCIEAKGKNKDDRVFAMALAIHFWNDSIRGVRKLLMSQGKTREVDLRSRNTNITSSSLHQLFNKSLFEDTIAKNIYKKKQKAIDEAKNVWRSWR